MSAAPIQAGDLVCVVRGGCLCVRGRIFRVEQLLVPTGLVCRTCLITRLKPLVLHARHGQGELNVPIEWCQRIPPLSDLDTEDAGQHATDEVTA